MFEITLRQAKLIDLLSNTDEYLPAKYFADNLNVSKRTIFNDLAKLESMYKKFDLVVDRKPNQGIKLVGDVAASRNSIQDVIANYLGSSQTSYSSLERQIIIAKWLLVNSQIVTYNAMSLDLYISSSSLIKDIERIRYFMGDELKLISNSKGTRIKGSEIAIQKTIKRFAYFLINKNQHNYSLASYAQVLEPLFDKNIIGKVYHSVQKITSTLNQNISEQYLKSFFISLLILTERSYRGYHLKDLPDIQLNGMELLTNHTLIKEICDDITSELSFEFTEIEQRYISNQLFAHRILVETNNGPIESSFSSDIETIIAEVSHAIDIDLRNDRNLFDSLINHILLVIYRLKSDINVRNPLLNEIKNNYAVLFRIVWYSMEKFEKENNVKLTDDEISFIVLYFQVAIERKKEISQVLVVCQTGLVTSDLIIQRIKNLLPTNIRFKLISKPKLESEDLSKVDFIISSVKLDKINHPVLYVSPLVRDSDLKNIYAYYLKYSSQRKKKDESTSNSDLVSTFINDRYIFMNEDVNTKEECLNKLIQRLEEDNIVNASFKASVYEREELGNTIVQGWVAVPHALSSEVNETKISIMTTKKPIKWNQESDVSFIILLAVAEDEDLSSIRKLLSHLYKILFSSKQYDNNVINMMSKSLDLIAFLRGGDEEYITSP